MAKRATHTTKRLPAPAPRAPRRPVAKFRRPAAQTAALTEIGTTGLKIRNGRVDDEFLQELKGRDGLKIFKEMADNDEVIGSILFAVSMMFRQAKRTIIPFDEKSSADKDVATLVDSCFDDMSHTAEDLLTEILTMLPYGHAYHEIVYKKRNGLNLQKPGESSRYSDGAWGWRKIPLRAQETLDKWEMDPQGGILGMWQQQDGGKSRFIPVSKALLFRTQSNKNNPEGRSILRNSYRPWYFKKRIQEIEGIGIERDLAGLPVLQSPEGADIWDEDDPDAVRLKTAAEKVVQNIRRDEQEGVLIPFGWELSLLSTGGQRSFDTSKIIDRYNTGIAMTTLADFIILGHNNRYGSMALAGSKTHMFGMAIVGWLNAIAAVFNRYAIPRLMAVNGLDIERPCRMTFTDIEVPNLAELGTYISNLQKAGFKMFPNIPLEKKLLSFAGLPTEGLLLGQEATPPKETGDGSEGDGDGAPPKKEPSDNESE